MKKDFYRSGKIYIEPDDNIDVEDLENIDLRLYIKGILVRELRTINNKKYNIKLKLGKFDCEENFRTKKYDVCAGYIYNPETNLTVYIDMLYCFNNRWYDDINIEYKFRIKYAKYIEKYKTYIFGKYKYFYDFENFVKRIIEQLEDKNIEKNDKELMKKMNEEFIPKLKSFDTIKYTTKSVFYETQPSKYFKFVGTEEIKRKYNITEKTINERKIKEKEKEIEKLNERIERIKEEIENLKKKKIDLESN